MTAKPKPSVATVALVAAPAPALKTGDDAEVATQFKKSFADAQGALQRVLAFGVYSAHIKYNCLKHGQFRRWVHAQCGEQAYRSVRSYLKLTEGVLKACGTKSLKASVSKWQQLPFCRSGQFLLADATEVPESVQPLRDKVLKLIENKTQRQLFFEFKQAEESGDNVKPKRGRLKCQGGATKAQRDAHQCPSLPPRQGRAGRQAGLSLSRAYTPADRPDPPPPAASSSSAARPRRGSAASATSAPGRPSTSRACCWRQARH